MLNSKYCNLYGSVGTTAKRTVRFIQRRLSSDSYLVRFISYYGMYFGRMLSPIRRNVFLCCSQFRVSIDDIMSLPVSHIYRHWRSRLSPDLIALTYVLLELISSVIPVMVFQLQLELQLVIFIFFSYSYYYY